MGSNYTLDKIRQPPFQKVLAMVYSDVSWNGADWCHRDWLRNM